MPTQTNDQNGTPAALRGGVNIGRIAGIDVRLHWTWFAAAVFVALTLADGIFPSEVKGLSNGAYLGMGLATTLLFFVSLLLHELGHALAARREGIPTRAITLWMLGGVAQSGAPFPTAGAEARIALAGPAVSAVLAVVLLAAGGIPGAPAGLAAVLEWLGWTNLILLGFNLLPALPMDGGRVLRAALWRLRRDYLRATRAAARVSHAVSVGMIGFGLLGGFATGSFAGLWLAFIGLFVFSAATAERASAEARAALSGVHVAEVMTQHPVTIASNATAQDLLGLALRTGHSCFPVTDEAGDAFGLVSVRVAERLPQRRRPWVSVRELVAEVPQPTPLDADAEVLSVVPTLVGNPLHRAPVVRAGTLVGLLSLTDVTRAVRLPADLGAA